jgi:hypothetical protein
LPPPRALCTEVSSPRSLNALNLASVAGAGARAGGDAFSGGAASAGSCTGARGSEPSSAGAAGVGGGAATVSSAGSANVEMKADEELSSCLSLLLFGKLALNCGGCACALVASFGEDGRHGASLSRRSCYRTVPYREAAVALSSSISGSLTGVRIPVGVAADGDAAHLPECWWRPRRSTTRRPQDLLERSVWTRAPGPAKQSLTD